MCLNMQSDLSGVCSLSLWLTRGRLSGPSLYQMSKSKKKKKVVSRRSLYLNGVPPSITQGVYLHLPPTLSSSFPSHASLSFPPPLIPSFSHMDGASHFHVYSCEWANSEWLWLDCSLDPEGRFAHSDWLWMVRQGAAAVLLRHLQEAFSSANHLSDFSVLWQTF